LDDEDFAIKAKPGSAFTEDWKRGLLAKDRTSIHTFTVQKECSRVKEHGIYSARVCTDFIFII